MEWRCLSGTLASNQDARERGFILICRNVAGADLALSIQTTFGRDMSNLNGSHFRLADEQTSIKSARPEFLRRGYAE